MNRVLFPAIAATLLLAGCAGGGQYQEKAINHHVTDADLELVKSEKALEVGTVVLWVNGLGCPLCASAIDKQLERVKGVSSVHTDLSVGKVTLTLGKGAASPKQLADAVLDAGFTLVKIETP